MSLEAQRRDKILKKFKVQLFLILLICQCSHYLSLYCKFPYRAICSQMRCCSTKFKHLSVFCGSNPKSLLKTGFRASETFTLCVLGSRVEIQGNQLPSHLSFSSPMWSQATSPQPNNSPSALTPQQKEFSRSSPFSRLELALDTYCIGKVCLCTFLFLIFYRNS